MFEKLEPTASWNDACLNAWSLINQTHLTKAETQCHTIGRAWLHSNIRKWTKESDIETKRQNLEDEGGTIIQVTVPLKSPLKEFHESSFRSKKVRL